MTTKIGFLVALVLFILAGWVMLAGLLWIFMTVIRWESYQLGDEFMFIGAAWTLVMFLVAWREWPRFRDRGGGPP